MSSNSVSFEYVSPKESHIETDDIKSTKLSCT